MRLLGTRSSPNLRVALDGTAQRLLSTRAITPKENINGYGAFHPTRAPPSARRADTRRVATAGGQSARSTPFHAEQGQCGRPLATCGPLPGRVSRGAGSLEQSTCVPPVSQPVAQEGRPYHSRRLARHQWKGTHSSGLAREAAWPPAQDALPHVPQTRDTPPPGAQSRAVFLAIQTVAAVSAPVARSHIIAVQGG